MTGCAFLTLCLPALLAAHHGPGPARSIAVHPPRVALSGPRAQQRLGVLATLASGAKRDLSREAKLTFDRPGIVKAGPGGELLPLADGTTTATVEAGGLKARVPVTVTGAKKDEPVSFSREVMAVLSRAGCNGGGCHGAQHGKGGFRLSVFGYDPAFDHSQIVTSAEGRRVVLSSPERSILLQKPSLVMEHAGGQRFAVGSKPYEVLRAWLEDGAPAPDPRGPEVKSLEAWPTRRQMVLGEKQQVIVRATWADGRVEDVTWAAQFDALNESVAAVTPDGLITARGVGESHIMVRFGGQARVIQVTLPYGPAGAAKMPANNFIDEKLLGKWRQLGLTPSPLASDEEFLRRVYLDAIGTLPTPKEAREFLADKGPKKREKLVDRLLERPEFIDFWALKWGDLLRINRDLLQEKGMWSFHNWVRASLRDGKKAGQMVREVLTAEGSTFTEGPANFYMASRTPADWSETSVQLFLGVRIQCARCHHHPFEKWGQDDYWAMTAYFSRLGTKTSQEFGLFGRETVVFRRPTGEARHPRTGTLLKPTPLGGEPLEDDTVDRRRRLADWVTAKGNPFFARNLANRFWAYTMGRGLVEPVDDLRETNPPSNPELLDALAADLEKHDYDIKHLLRTIFRSRAYQLSSAPAPGNKADATNAYHTRYTQKRLTAEQLADAIDEVTGTREKYPGLPLGTRAIQLPDTKVRSFLLDVFGRPPRQVTCECERASQPNLAQALHLLNSDFLNRKIEAPTGRVAALVKARKKPAEIVDELYLAALARFPTPPERAHGLKVIQKGGSVAVGAQDLMWGLLNRRAFQFVR